MPPLASHEGLSTSHPHSFTPYDLIKPSFSQQLLNTPCRPSPLLVNGHTNTTKTAMFPVHGKIMERDR